MASKRRHNFQIKIVLIGLLVVALMVGAGYSLFYASWFKVDTVAFEGLTDRHQEDVQKVVDDALNRKILGIPFGRSIFFISSDSLTADLTSRFSFIEKISVQKKYFRTLEISATERQAEGVWCFHNDGSDSSTVNCRYFDHEGVIFGQAVQSSGVLLLNVDDMRIQTDLESLTIVDQIFFKAIQTTASALKNQGVKIKNVIIPADSYTEFNILINDPALPTGVTYLLKFSTDSNIQNQLDVFRIFRTQKIAGGSLRPQYIDLRFDDRVYFK